MSRKNHNDEFKKQIVSLFRKGKPVSGISREYEISRSMIYKWISQYENSGSFKAVDNRTPEENELIALKKRNKELEMEVDILKQAALIMGRK